MWLGKKLEEGTRDGQRIPSSCENPRKRFKGQQIKKKK